MRFVYAPTADYSDLASGNVLHSAPGFPAFPVRLALELFERARQFTGRSRVAIWDPLCGAGGIVTTLGLVRPEAISHVLATDVSQAATALAARNLELLSEDGLRRRAAALAERSAERAQAAERLLRGLAGAPPITTHVAVADATRAAQLDRLALESVDIVIADLPYGNRTEWVSDSPVPALELLGQLRRCLRGDAVIVLSSTRRADVRGGPGALRAFKHGTRYITFYGARVDQD